MRGSMATSASVGSLKSVQLLSVLILCSVTVQASYMIGTGIADCTGPAAGVNMVGTQVGNLILKDLSIHWWELAQT